MSNRQISETTKGLIAGKARINTEAKWCRGARFNSRGQRCALGALSPGADLFEVDGLVKILAETAIRPTLKEVTVYGKFEDVYGGNWDTMFEVYKVAGYNNTRATHQEVMEWFDRAIALSIQCDNA